jgi:hypothetical protein
MTETAGAMPANGAGQSSGQTNFAPLLFGVVVFVSASLVFLVEPMVAKLLLPSQGGSPMVWNTCMAFFQMALLLGYAYAHLLQRVRSVKTQAIIHAVILLVAALALPLHMSGALGAPGKTAPALWLLGTLAVSLGAPFAALSATAPLAQAWYARVRAGHEDAKNPYVLYAASNLGSLIALVAYPVIIEPGLRLSIQTLSWSIGYGGFVVLMALAALFAARSKGEMATAALAKSEAAADAKPITWTDRLIWVGLAAAPSSLMLGVTTHITTDIASAPFLWVAPLALYLITFIIAFQTRPVIPYNVSLLLQALLVAAMAATFNLPATWWVFQLVIHLLAFFFTALICHQALAQRRPDAAQLTEFYLLMSLGGVIGGSFNAFLAPVIFSGVWEYPLVMVLACFARPWRAADKPKAWEEIAFGLVAGALVLGFVMHVAGPHLSYELQDDLIQLSSGDQKLPLFGHTYVFTYGAIGMAVCVVVAFLSRERVLWFTPLIAAITIGSFNFGPKADLLAQERSFFGVLKLTEVTIPGLGGKVKILAHGTTLHGVQAENPTYACRPTVYYAPTTPIGQVFDKMRKARAHLAIGAVGMGAGTVAAYTKPGDYLRFFEIDQKVIDMSSNPKNFSYIRGCSRGIVDVRKGDARLSLRTEPKGFYNILLIDAFTSDAVPAHLLTVEAMRDYLSHLTPDGIVIMHLSNRHLDLMSPVAAVASAAGGASLAEGYNQPENAIDFSDASEEAIIVARTPEALDPYRSDPRWVTPQPNRVRPWTDDYTNLFGAMWRRLWNLDR